MWTVRRRLLTVLGLGFVLSSGCELLAPTFAEPGLIIFYGDTARVVAPDTAMLGVPFEASVQTFAGGCTREIDRTETAVLGTIAEIRPYNETQRRDVCTLDLLILTHTAMVQFDQSGEVTLRVVGEQRPFQGNGRVNGPAELERRVVIH